MFDLPDLAEAALANDVEIIKDAFLYLDILDVILVQINKLNYLFELIVAKPRLLL